MALLGAGQVDQPRRCRSTAGSQRVADWLRQIPGRELFVHSHNLQQEDRRGARQELWNHGGGLQVQVRQAVDVLPRYAVSGHVPVRIDRQPGEPLSRGHHDRANREYIRAPRVSFATPTSTALVSAPG
jgi:hypothetical protein